MSDSMNEGLSSQSAELRPRGEIMVFHDPTAILEKAQKAADKDDLGGAAEAAGEAQEACQEASDALDEAKKLMAAVELPEPEEGAAPAEGAPPPAAKGAPPAGPKAGAKKGTFEAWAER